MDNNPWTVEDLDSYLFYCCPECDQKYKSKPSFINHAYSSHPDAQSKESCEFNIYKMHSNFNLEFSKESEMWSILVRE